MVFFQYYHTLLLFMIWLGLLKLMMTTHTLLCLSRWRYENLIVDQGVCIFLFNYRAFMMWFWFNNNDHMNLYVLFNYVFLPYGSSWAWSVGCSFSSCTSPLRVLLSLAFWGSGLWWTCCVFVLLSFRFGFYTLVLLCSLFLWFYIFLNSLTSH